jgi:ornithine carbamoyltransferase
MYPLTFEELKERLKQLDEMTLLELLDLTSEELVELLSDQIELKQQKLRKNIDDTFYY